MLKLLHEPLTALLETVNKINNYRIINISLYNLAKTPLRNRIFLHVNNFQKKAFYNCKLQVQLLQTFYVLYLISVSWSVDKGSFDFMFAVG